MLGKSDGCTCSPDGLFGVNWRPCCENHDYAYRIPELPRTRREADRDLRTCMQASAKGRGAARVALVWSVSWIYWAAVRATGWYFWKPRR